MLGPVARRAAVAEHEALLGDGLTRAGRPAVAGAMENLMTSPTDSAVVTTAATSRG